MVFARVQVQLAGLIEANGLVQVRAEYHEAAFGSAFAEYRGAAGALRLVWDGKDAMLFAELLVDGRWIDVETLAAGRAPSVDHDQSDERIARIAKAVTAALSRRG
jgi:hypothetical protein